MSTPPSDRFEDRLHETAHQLNYPPTPDISGATRAQLTTPRTRRVSLTLRLAVVTLMISLAVVVAIPQVRAQLAGFFRIGVVSILPFNPTDTPEPTLQIPITATLEPSISPTPNPLPFTLNNLAGLTTLENAKKQSNFPIRLPAYPTDLGAPDYVFYQNQAPMVILAWMDPTDSDRVRLSLHEIAPGSAIVKKFEPSVIQETAVKGHYAVWTEGPYILQVKSGGYDLSRLVEGHALIWEEAGITYRLETDLPLEETIKIAVSLQ